MPTGRTVKVVQRNSQPSERPAAVDRPPLWSRRTLRGRVALLAGLVGLVGATLLQPAVVHAAGPRHAQVIDAETREPLAGVAVLAVWSRGARGHPAISFTDTGYYKSAETATGPDGRFTIPWRILFALGFGVEVRGPEIALFKAGYGGWRFAGSKDMSTGDGAVIEMRPLRTAADQVRYLERKLTPAERDQLGRVWRGIDGPQNPSDVPWREARAYEAAINAERAAHGLRPIGIGFPGLGTQYLLPPQAEAPGEARLRGASGIATDAAGNVYVADTENHRIVKYSPTLTVLKTWGTFGREKGQLQFPRGVAVDSRGYVLVADSGNHRMQWFTGEGRLVGGWGERRVAEYGGRFAPGNVAITASGEIVVFLSGQVWRFTEDGRLLGVSGSAARLSGHSGIAVDADGNVFGINGDWRPGPRVLKLDRAGNRVAGWGSYGSGWGQLHSPYGLAVDARGRVYVAAGGDARVVVFDRVGAVLEQWDLLNRWQEGPAWTRVPTALTVDARGYVYVVGQKQPRPLRLGPVPGEGGAR